VIGAPPTRLPFLHRAARGRAAGLVLAALLVVLGAPAFAPAQQNGGRSPSADELWQEYPLQQRPHAEADGTAVPATPQPPAATPLPASSKGSGGVPVLPLVIVGALLLALVAILLVRVRRGEPREHRWLANAVRSLHRTPTLAAASGPAFDAQVQMNAPEEGGAARLWRSQRREPEGPPPPNVHRSWTAEVSWDHAEGKGRFRVLASSKDDATTVVIAESEPLEWPPRGPASVQAMSRAADELESSLLAAGWKPLPPGEAWYAKRFAWQRVAAPAVTVTEEEVETKRRRFARRVPWDEGTEELARCELEWRPGYVNSRFEAVVYHPGRKRGQPIGGSGTFKWLLMGDPDATAPEYRAEIDRLSGALETTGWERVGDGTNWFSRRFVWRGSAPPPERLEAGPAATGRTTD
jgi:hypothetical protein